MPEPLVKSRGVSDPKPRNFIRPSAEPLAVLSTCPSAFNDTSLDASAPGPTRILVIDDDDRICELLSHVLRRSRYYVECASGGEQALSLLSQRAFDMVVCDMHLGGMTGLALTELASNLYRDVPFILMTGYRDTALMREALRQGAVDFIPKPFDSEVIPLIIERNLERRALNLRQAEVQRQNQIFSNVQALAVAIDAKEPYTAEHSRRVARLSRATAEAMDLPSSEQQSVDWAGQVHDVGKIATPDYILLKIGRLTDDEWRIIREHPAKGAQIVGQVQDLGFVAGIVRSHHERIDGTGYPDGLCGDQIPLLSRIIAVSDAFEVMTSNRVYRSRISDAKAISRLNAGANTQFDAAVVTAFISLPTEVHR